MDIQMRVHRVSMHHVERTVTHEGEEARAMVAELEVELADLGEGHGSLQLHFRSQSKIAAAKEVFDQGGLVCLAVTKVDEAPAVIDTAAEEPAAA